MIEGSRFDRCSWVGCRAECVDEIELCWYHFRLAGLTYINARSIFGASALAEQRQKREAAAAERRANERDPSDLARERSVVYYIRLGDHVKIGYTTLLRDRVIQLRCSRDSVLAVEPGWREREAERHAMFAPERVGRREDFNPSRRLLGHITAMRNMYGEPFAFAARRAAAAGPKAVS